MVIWSIDEKFNNWEIIFQKCKKKKMKRAFFVDENGWIKNKQ